MVGLIISSPVFYSQTLDVAQVRVVFQLQETNGLLKHLTTTPLCYVHYFHILPLDAGRHGIGLHQVECVHPSTGCVTGIVPSLKWSRL